MKRKFFLKKGYYLFKTLLWRYFLWQIFGLINGPKRSPPCFCENASLVRFFNGDFYVFFLNKKR